MPTPPPGAVIRSGLQQLQQPTAPETPASPPSKRDLKSWWKGFKLPTGKNQETNGTDSHARSKIKYLAPSSRYSGVSRFSEDSRYPFPELLEAVLAQHDAQVEAHALPRFPAASSSVVRSSDATSGDHGEACRSFGRFKTIVVAPFRCFISEPSADRSSSPPSFTRRGHTKPCTVPETRPQGIFGVPLRQSITYANVAISLVDEHGSSYIYGYVPIVVAKCGVFLKEKATEVEGIFRLNGSEKRIKELKNIFDEPDRYGKGLVWDKYTVHDASNVFRRYLNDLPEPVVPLDLYEKFRDPLRGATKQATGDAEGPQFVEDFDEQAAIAKYQQLITELPPLNRQLLLYILDLLAVFAAKSDLNRMNSQNLAAIFQPGMLSHPGHAMAPEEYRLNQCVLIFLIENQDHFLIGMQGTAADEKTKQEVEHGTPVLAAAGSPSTPTPGGQDSNLGRSASNASAGAESVRRDGKIRRNRSTSSRHSRNEGGATPVSPVIVTTPTGGGLARSNTVPSKKSPALAAGRFHKDSSPLAVRQPNFTTAPEDLTGDSPAASTITPSNAGNASLSPTSGAGAGRSQERLLEPPSEGVSTPTKERNLQSLFQRSPTSEGDKRQRNKLKKRVPAGGTQNASAHSSTASLPHSTGISPGRESNNPLEAPPERLEGTPTTTPSESQQVLPAGDDSSEPTPRGSHMPPALPTLHPENSLKPKKSPSTSLHSSFNEGSEFDHVDEPLPPTSNVEVAEKEKKKRWRLSRPTKKEEVPVLQHSTLASPRPGVGTNLQAEDSSLSLASGSVGKPRKSFTNDSSDPSSSIVETQLTQESGSSSQKEKSESGKDESTKNPIGWIRNKYREAKETQGQRRNKSPPANNKQASSSTSILSIRGKSLDLKREEERLAHLQQQSLLLVQPQPQHAPQPPILAVEQPSQPPQPERQTPLSQPQPNPHVQMPTPPQQQPAPHPHPSPPAAPTAPTARPE